MPVWLTANSVFLPPKKLFFSVPITSLCCIRSFMISSTSGLLSLVTLAILSTVFIPLDIASRTMKWFGLSLTRTFDISMVLCAKHYFKYNILARLLHKPALERLARSNQGDDKRPCEQG